MPLENNEKYQRKPLFRQIEIVKLLQGRKMRTSEIAEHFRPGCDDSFIRAIQHDLEALRDGVDVFGFTMRIEESTESHSTKYYKSTVHPIFLGLNLTELFALLNLLEDHSDEQTYRAIFDSVYSQITDYAVSQLSPKLKDKHTREQGAARNNLDEDRFQSNFLYLWKSGSAVSITYETKAESGLPAAAA
jgi:hypothetical protein